MKSGLLISKNPLGMVVHFPGFFNEKLLKICSSFLALPQNDKSADDFIKQNSRIFVACGKCK